MAPFPRLALRFAWFDCWIGWFWKGRRRHLHICLLPMLPLIVRFPYRHRCDVGGCSEPATHVCRRNVSGDRNWDSRSILFGDPLCEEHSRMDCSFVRLGYNAHVPLPAAERWYFEDLAA